MNRIISIIRISILFILSGIALFFLHDRETEASLPTWILCFIIDKSLAVCAAFSAAKLYKRWSRIDPWLIRYAKKCEALMEIPSPGKSNNLNH